MTFHLIVLFLLVRLVIATLVNVTIDDQYGDPSTGFFPSYSPLGLWQLGTNCSTCRAHPNPAQAWMGTWHDTTHLPTETEPCVVSLLFNGSAVYVYFILANGLLTNLTFTLDGTYVGNFAQTPSGSQSYYYNTPVYVNATLPNLEHELLIEAGGPTDSILLFDYATYTHHSNSTTPATILSTTGDGSLTTLNSDSTTASIIPSTTGDGSSNTSSHSSLPGIIGGTVGGITVVILVAILLVCRHKMTRGVLSINGSKHGSEREHILHPTPFNLNNNRNADNSPNTTAPISGSASTPVAPSTSNSTSSDVRASTGDTSPGTNTRTPGLRRDANSQVSDNNFSGFSRIITNQLNIDARGANFSSGQ